MHQESEWWKEDAARVSSVAGLIDSLVAGDDDLRALVVEWLIGSQGGGIGEPIGIRRALIVILAKDAITLKGLFEKSLQQFSNQLWIKHAPILQQEGLFNLSLYLISRRPVSAAGDMLLVHLSVTTIIHYMLILSLLSHFLK